MWSYIDSRCTRSATLPDQLTVEDTLIGTSGHPGGRTPPPNWRRMNVAACRFRRHGPRGRCRLCQRFNKHTVEHVPLPVIDDAPRQEYWTDSDTDFVSIVAGTGNRKKYLIKYKKSKYPVHIYVSKREPLPVEQGSERSGVFAESNVTQPSAARVCMRRIEQSGGLDYRRVRPPGKTTPHFIFNSVPV